MADWRDVMNARQQADESLGMLAYAQTREEMRGRNADAGTALLSAARAICLELRALGTLLDYASRAK